MKRHPNPLKLGKQQKRILKDMCENGNVIRVVQDGYDLSADITLQSEDGMNDYEKISYPMLKSLGNRHLFVITEWIPSWQMRIITYRIKSKIKQELLLHL